MGDGRGSPTDMAGIKDPGVCRFFPHESFRPRQSEGLEAVRKCAVKGVPLIFSSPTGTGKTAMVLAGLLSARAKGEKIAAVTRTHSQYVMFVEEFGRIKEKNPDLALGMLVGRRSVCPKGAGHLLCGMLRKNTLAEIRKGLCGRYNAKALEAYERNSVRVKNPVCPYYMNCFQKENARPLYNRGSMELVNGQMNRPKTPEGFRKTCTEDAFPKCPYELMRSTLAKADILILHYLYILDPEVRESIIATNRLGCGLEKIRLAVDESHNLAAYIQDICSISCTKKDVEDAIKLLRDGKAGNIAYPLKDIEEDRTLLIMMLSEFDVFLGDLFAKKTPEELSGEGTEDVLTDKGAYKPDPEHLRLLEYAACQVKKQFESKKRNMEEPEETHLPGICSVAETLRNLSQERGDRFITTLSIRPASRMIAKKLDGTLSTEDYDISLRITDIDPRDTVKYLAGSFRSLTLISGTLSPTNLYRKLFFYDDIDVEELGVPYPFPEVNRLVIACRNASSQKKQRADVKNIAAVKDCIKALFSVEGNIAVFFTGYETKRQYMSYCAELCTKTGKKFMDESREKNRSRFLEEYRTHGNAALLAVCKGSFSEGVDFMGEAMKAVAIIGLPLAPWNQKQGMINGYYENAFGRGVGKRIAYDLPAVTAAVQAAGRCIRSPEDTGVILLCDARYASAVTGVRGMLPEWMQKEMLTLDAEEIEERIKKKTAEWKARPSARKEETPRRRTDSRKAILETIAETGERYGKERIAEILAGSRSMHVRDAGLDRLQHCGILGHMTQKAIEKEMEGMIKERLLYRTWGLYPALKLRRKGRDILDSR
ncbi:MAG: hypothetical protein JW724_01445 [Candidatus Altiarchaeota archaeon]|nr:hypothetical protein [Candidatus Altiarchaeota archaeon]